MACGGRGRGGRGGVSDLYHPTDHCNPLPLPSPVPSRGEGGGGSGHKHDNRPIDCLEGRGRTDERWVWGGGERRGDGDVDANVDVDRRTDGRIGGSRIDL